MPKVRIGVLFGGSGEEHPISVKSAREVAKHLDAKRYEPFFVGITRTGAWKLCTGPEEGWDASTTTAVISPNRDRPGLLVGNDGWYDTVSLDLVLPVVHGRHGEDGAMQGLLELAGIPYAGCDVPSSALCIDKALAYLVVRSAGVVTPNHWTLASGEDADAAALPFPVFVKPARSGSSFGVTKVSCAEELRDAVLAARQYDSKVLIEEAVVGTEVGCAIHGAGSDLFAGEVDQIALSEGFFRIHQEREPEQGSDNATVIVPADISADARRLVQETAKTIYRALGCSGLARVDMFLTDDGTVVLNEVNTMPGMTSYSRYPRMMAAAGLSFADVLDRIVALTLSGAGR